MDGPGGAQRDDGGVGFLSPGQYLLHDRTGNTALPFNSSSMMWGQAGAPATRSPNLNAYAERLVRSVKEECLSRVILFGEASLHHALTEYVGIFIMSGIIRARAMCCSFLWPARTQSMQARCSVVNGSGGS